ncbi:MAG TPA: type II secretion system F family protein [Terriglobales bacterium]|nr:type II secretion system F family protein [Terriglobales bacterium]
MDPALVISLMATVFLALAIVPAFLLARRSDERKRLMEVTRSPLRLEEEPAESANPAMRLLLRLVRFLRTRLGFTQDEKLRQKLLAAGIRESSAVETYFGIRLLGPVAAVLAGTFIHQNSLFWILTLMAAAYLAPDLWVNYRARARRERIRLGLPDALDLMVVCVDAGLGIDQALLRSGQELALSQPEISQEFIQINFEQRAGKPRIEAWQSMADRTQVETVRSFVYMLAQTDRFGTPLVRALRVFADSVRQKRRQHAEELAAKTTVKLIFPLVLFIFPSIFIVLLGPAVILITKNLQGIFK